MYIIDFKYNCENNFTFIERNFSNVNLDDIFVQYVLNGIYDNYTHSVIAFNLKHMLDSEKFSLDLLKLYNRYEKYLSIDYTLEQLHICDLYYNRIKQKNFRLKKRLNDYFEKFDNLVFVTLTFRDDILNNTNVDTRRKYVQRFLKKNCEHYVANIDFGFNDNYTHREHYHAIATDIIDCSLWSYGIVNVKRVVVKNAGALTHYINKLTNHAFKLSTRLNTRLIYSRRNF